MPSLALAQKNKTKKFSLGNVKGCRLSLLALRHPYTLKKRRKNTLTHTYSLWSTALVTIVNQVWSGFPFLSFPSPKAPLHIPQPLIHQHLKYNQHLPQSSNQPLIHPPNKPTPHSLNKPNKHDKLYKHKQHKHKQHKNNQHKHNQQNQHHKQHRLECPV